MELKECPFCRGDAMLMEEVEVKYAFTGRIVDKNDIYRVECSGCRISTKACATADEAATIWNERSV